MATNFEEQRKQVHNGNTKNQQKQQQKRQHQSKNLRTDIPPGGYDVILLSLIPKKYKCPICTYLMRDPIQTYRGEMACKACYVDALKISGGVCPIDGDVIGEAEMFFQDKAASRDILQLESYCPNKQNKCKWIGKIKDLESHSSICDFKEITCDLCYDVFLRKDKEQHDTEKCKFRKVPCKYCSTTYDAQLIEDHQGGCHKKPMKCPYDCGSPIVMDKLFMHIDNCPKIKNGNMCPYTIVGCGFKPSNRADLQKHMVTEAQSHAAWAITLVTTLNQTNEQLKQDLLREQNLQVEMTKRMEEQSKHHAAISSEIETIKEKLNNLKQDGIELVQTCEANEAKIKEDISQIDTRLQQEDLHEIQRKVQEIEAKYEDFDAKIKSGRIGTKGSSKGPLFDEMNQVTEKVDQLERGSAVLSANLSDLELKLQLFENTSYTGRQLWKVDNVMYRMNQAVTGKVTALHSAPCFQKMGGYKFCCRLYLNGDGMGRGTHVSLFFVVMKSEYDALLQWPFTERVTFRLINPYNKEETLKESFIPDRNSSSFKRPTKDMNIAAGCPMLLRKEKLPQFIIDDVIYIECTVGDGEAAH